MTLKEEIPRVTIPLNTGLILLCVWLGWKVWDLIGFNGYDWVILGLGVILVILTFPAMEPPNKKVKSDDGED